MKNETECDLAKLYVFFGKRWSHSIFTNLSEKSLSYNEIYAISKRHINPTLLSNRMKDMIRFKLIDIKTEDKRKKYVLTSYGKELKRIFHEIKRWSHKSGYNISEQCRINDCICNGVFKKDP